MTAPHHRATSALPMPLGILTAVTVPFLLPFAVALGARALGVSVGQA